MKKLIPTTSLVGLLTLLSNTAHAAGEIPQVPEIDRIAMLADERRSVGVVALIREYRRKK